MLVVNTTGMLSSTVQKKHEGRTTDHVWTTFFSGANIFSWRYSNFEQGTCTSISLKPVYLGISSGVCIFPGPVLWFNLLAAQDTPLINWSQFSQLNTPQNSCSPQPTCWQGSMRGKNDFTLNEHCSAIAKESECCQCCFHHKSKTSPKKLYKGN